MARDEITVQTTTRAGITPSYQAIAAVNDGMFVNDGEVTLHVKNASGSTASLTFVTPATVLSDALAVADATGSVADGAEKVFGPFPTAWFNQPSGDDIGKVYVDTDQDITVYAEKRGALS